MPLHYSAAERLPFFPGGILRIPAMPGCAFACMIHPNNRTAQFPQGEKP
jgi:hypothetical protein